MASVRLGFSGSLSRLGLGTFLLEDGGELLLLDAGLLALEVAEIEYPCPADLTDLVQLDGVDGGGVVGENPLHTDAAGDLPDGEGLGVRGCPADLDDYSSEFLEPVLVTLLDLKDDGDGVTGLELGV